MHHVVRSSVLVYVLLLPSIAAAQSTSTTAGTTATSAQASAAEQADPDLKLNPAQPDFTLGALPTTLRMPAGKFSFRLTHRFSRPIASGSTKDFFADLFGFDSSAKVGFELRYGVRPGTQVVFHRTNDRAIQLLGQQQLLRQDGHAFAADAVVAVEGDDNLSENFSGTVGAVLSRQFSEKGAVYVHPIFVSNTAQTDSGEKRNTMLLGFGARIRLGQSRAYVVAEAAPQVGGYRDGVDHVSFGIEKRAGGHMFQLVIANSLGTTMRQVARGGVHDGDWYIGFNLTRRFF